VISDVDGATEFTMDVFEIDQGGHSAFHEHDWEHQIFVLNGQGTLVGSDRPVPFKQGDVIFIAPGEPHQNRQRRRGTRRVRLPDPEGGADRLLHRPGSRAQRGRRPLTLLQRATNVSGIRSGFRHVATRDKRYPAQIA
jgi:mannose-6-phosphate isomerase-like protein (cupin superfamily)